MSKTLARKPQTTTVEIASLGVTASAMRKPVDLEVFTTDVSVIRDTVERLGKAANGVMFDAAMVLANGMDLSEVTGEGKPYEGQGHLAETLGYSKSYGSRLVRIGRAVIWFGVRAGSKDYALLCDGTYGASAEAFKPFLAKKMTEVPDKDTVTKFRATLAAQHDARAKGTKPEPKGRQAKPEGEGDTAPESTREVAPTKGDVISALEGLVPTVHALSWEDQEAIHDWMLRFVRGERKRQATLTKAEQERQEREDAKAETIEAGEVETVEVA